VFPPNSGIALLGFLVSHTHRDSVVQRRPKSCGLWGDVPAAIFNPDNSSRVSGQNYRMDVRRWTLSRSGILNLS
jgi:hypothetical protein